MSGVACLFPAQRLAGGVDLKVIQKRLGHRNLATTANTVSHLLAGAQHDALAKVDDLLKRAKNSG
ncbi:MAG: integrase [Planctomycetaceae bacterium]